MLLGTGWRSHVVLIPALGPPIDPVEDVDAGFSLRAKIDIVFFFGFTSACLSSADGILARAFSSSAWIEASE